LARRQTFAAATLVAIVCCGVPVIVGAVRHHGARRSNHDRRADQGLLPGAPARPPVATAGSAGSATSPGGLDQGVSLPAGTWSLPGPGRYEGVAGVGYPQTTLGAVALGYSALAARFTADPDLAVSVARATVLAPTQTFLQAVAQGTEGLRTRFGLTPTGPSATTIALSLIGCRVGSVSESRVVAGYEGTLSVEGGAVQATTADVSVAISLAWDGSDWKIDPTVDLPTPPIEFPANVSSATRQGWHACDEA
jgi:hypothetical protein